MKLIEIAQLAGVSKTTVSYIINGKAKQYRVSDKTIEKVMKVIAEHNYIPNQTASSLRLGKTKTIGFVIPDLENASYMRIAKYIEQLARDVGYQIFLSCSEDDKEIEKQCILNFKQRNVDAIIVATSSAEFDSFYQNWDNLNTPIYTLDRVLPTSHFYGLSSTDRQDAKLLASRMDEHLEPESTIVFCGAHANLQMSIEREEGFKASLKHRHQIDFLYTDDYGRERAKQAFNAYFDDHQNQVPDGVFLTSFSLLQGFFDAILNKKVKLSEHFIIATFGDNEWLNLLPCKVISLSQQHKKIAETLFKTILQDLSDGNLYEPKHIKVSRICHYRGTLK